MDSKGKNVIKKAVSICLLGLSASMAYCGTMGSATAPPVKVYLGVFGGGGALSSLDINQHGTAFFTEAAGGPLAVNAFGSSESSSIWMIGGQIGFAWPNAGLSFPVTPAMELEGYYIGGVDVTGHDINNDTVRLPEHDFLVTYPLKTGVFLVNAILNSNTSLYGKFKPYLGVGIGGAVISVSGATSLQVAPPEAGVNHYDGRTSDRALAFAAQPKIGLRYDFSPNTSVFAEYRFLYLSDINYTFGSTIAEDHAPTSPWLARLEPQLYNMGTVGIAFDL